ncbi:MAG: hypothetical protein PHY93_04225 [Bacteriovorax sp.]|nr:hypothetical protein [Bacteriovorax sp.]
MSDQPASGNNNDTRPPASNNPNNNSRRNQNSRRRPQGGGGGPRPQQQQGQAQPQGQSPQGSGGPRPPQQQQGQGRPPGQSPQGGGGPRPQLQQQGQNPQGGGGQRRRPNRNSNRPRNPNPGANPNQNINGPQGINIERIYEKYLNLLDQHLIARRKYHDLFFRADPGQKNKLERNFYNTLNDIRDFESKLAPEARELFEKRNNGLSPDNIYTSNHEIPMTGENPPPEAEWADPHFTYSQQLADYAGDKEESTGSLDDYLKYKNLI